MKQHPVDDLFARKLNEHSLEPKRATWEEMQKRLHPQPLHREKRIGGIWWYAAAASVLVALFLGRSLWQEQEPIANKNYVATKKPAKAYTNKDTDNNLKVEMPSGDKQLAAVNPTKEAQKASSNPIEVLDKQPSTLGKAPSVNEEKLMANVDEPSVQTHEAIVNVEQKQILLATLEKKPMQKEPARTLVVQLDEPIIARAEPLEEVEATTVQEHKKKRLRLGRLIRQFNNLREGEPLNLKDAGIDPSNILAKASDKVQDGKERIGESYEQLRSRTFRNN